MRWRDALPLLMAAPLAATGIGGVGYAAYLNWGAGMDWLAILFITAFPMAILLAAWFVWAVFPHWGEY